MNLALLTLIGAALPHPAPSEPGLGTSTRAGPMFYPTPEELGLGPTPKEQARMERELLPGPPNRKQRRSAARRMR